MAEINQIGPFELQLAAHAQSNGLILVMNEKDRRLGFTPQRRIIAI